MPAGVGAGVVNATGMTMADGVVVEVEGVVVEDAVEETEDGGKEEEEEELVGGKVVGTV